MSTTAQPPNTRPCAVEGCAGIIQRSNVHKPVLECELSGDGGCCNPDMHHTYVPTVDPRDELIARIRDLAGNYAESPSALAFYMRRIHDLIAASLKSRERTGAVQMNDKAADTLMAELDRLRGVIAEIETRIDKVYTVPKCDFADHDFANDIRAIIERARK